MHWLRYISRRRLLIYTSLHVDMEAVKNGQTILNIIIYGMFRKSTDEQINDEQKIKAVKCWTTGGEK